MRYYYKKDPDIYPLNDVWVAVAAADRLNGNNFFGPNSILENMKGLGLPVDAKFNKTVAVDILESLMQAVSDEDRELGFKLGEHYSGLLFKALTGTINNNFIANVAKIISKEKVSKSDVAYLAPLVRSYYKDLAREQKEQDQLKMASSSAFLGSVGDRLNLKIKLIDQIFIRSYNFYIYTATDGSNLIKFTSARGDDTFRVGQEIAVKASIKKHEVGFKNGVNETWLTRVKVL